MKVLFFGIASALAIWSLINYAWCRALSEREKSAREAQQDLARGYSQLRSEQAHTQATKEVLAREKEQFKERELNLAARKESVLELEATLLSKQRKLDELDKVLNEKDQILNEKAELLDTRAAELKDYADILDGVQSSLAEREQKATTKKAKKK